MNLVKEPLDIDFYVSNKPLSKAEEMTISEYIKADKKKRKPPKTEKGNVSNMREIKPER